MLFGGLQLAFVAAAAFAVYGFVTVAKEAEHRRACTPECLIHPDYAGAEKLAPDFTLKDMKGRELKLSDYRGKVVLLNFWTKNCGPCLKEMPSLGELAHMVADRKDVAIITVSTDEGPVDVKDTLKSLLREEAPFPVLFDPGRRPRRERKVRDSPLPGDVAHRQARRHPRAVRRGARLGEPGNRGAHRSAARGDVLPDARGQEGGQGGGGSGAPLRAGERRVIRSEYRQSAAC